MENPPVSAEQQTEYPRRGRMWVVLPAREPEQKNQKIEQKGPYWRRRIVNCSVGMSSRLRHYRLFCSRH